MIFAGAIGLGIDGMVPRGIIAPDPCCPPSICQISFCTLASQFLLSLPSGPLWDRAKEKARESMCAPTCNGSLISCPPPVSGFTHLVQHALHTAEGLHDWIQNALWVSILESSPYTAYDTLDEWLDRLRWVDCYACACRNTASSVYAPIAILNDCGEACCPELAIDLDLQVAVKKGTVIALAILSMGVTSNLDGMNAVIESLGAKVVLASHEPNGKKCPKIVFKVCPASDKIVKAARGKCSNRPLRNCCGNTGDKLIQAYYQKCMDTDPIGLPDRVYPGVLAAECIIKSMIPPCSDITVISCCEVTP
jgi:hypothetical protein